MHLGWEARISDGEGWEWGRHLQNAGCRTSTRPGASRRCWLPCSSSTRRGPAELSVRGRRLQDLRDFFDVPPICARENTVLWVVLEAHGSERSRSFAWHHGAALLSVPVCSGGGPFAARQQGAQRLLVFFGVGETTGMYVCFSLSSLSGVSKWGSPRNGGFIWFLFRATTNRLRPQGSPSLFRQEMFLWCLFVAPIHANMSHCKHC